jgi:CRISPR-associated exonuclease Cas4
MMNDPQEDEPLLISALNQYLFCPRRCALMHVEGVWADNVHTAKGALLHEHADSGGYEVEKGVKLLRGLPLYSVRYGLSGRADIVEVRGAVYAPVEYKKGKRRQFENDDVQLCAQGLCLEEMFGGAVARGFIYHAASKRRREVQFDAALRAMTVETIAAVRDLLQAGRVPAARLLPRCDGCSLRGVCMPELSDTSRAVAETAARELWE